MPRTIVRKSARTPKSRRRQAALTDRWDLTPLMENPTEHLGRYLKQLDGMVSQFEASRSRLAATMPTTRFVPLLKLSEDISKISASLSAYSYLRFAENTLNSEARSFKTQVDEKLTALHNRMLFFDLWWQSVDARNAARLRAAAGDFAYHLDTIRRFTGHTLSEAEEKVVNLKNVTGRHAVTTLYDVLTNGLSFTLTVNGKKRTLTREQLASYVRHTNPQIREKAYRELLHVFESNRDVVAEIFTILINDWKAENLELRKYSSPIAVRNLGNDVPNEAVAALLAVCARNAPVFQRYFTLKGRISGIRPMSRYHIYAPHKAERKRYRYSDAVTMVLRAYRSFSPTLADLAERVFRDRHIDAQSRPGKMSGAFCYSVTPGLTPYVHLNYTGEARDVATLAHELGHAVHGLMASEHTVFTFHSTLPLAETASVFGERILSDALMSEETDRAVKQSLLVSQLDDIYATVMRQAYFVIFERTAHDLVARGATIQDLGQAYLENLREQFGSAVKVPPEFRWEWLTIPHIFASPFYCYAYSFGNLLVLALYQQYKQQGSAFVPKYLELLAAGGSQSPEAIVGRVGVDLRSEAFWQSGFDTIAAMVEELEKTLR